MDQAPLEKFFSDFDKWHELYGVDLFIIEVLYYFNK